VFSADAVKTLISGDVSGEELPESEFERAVTAGRVGVVANVVVTSEGEFAEDAAGSKPEDVKIVEDENKIDEG